SQNGSRTAACAHGHGTGDYSLATECAAVDLHRPAARAGTSCVIDHQAAAFNRGASGVSVSMSENQLAAPYFAERSSGATIVDRPGKGRAQVVGARYQVMSSQKDITVAFERTNCYCAELRPSNI